MIIKINYGNGNEVYYETSSFKKMIMENTIHIHLDNGYIEPLVGNFELYVMENGKTVDRITHIVEQD